MGRGALVGCQGHVSELLRQRLSSKLLAVCPRSHVSVSHPHRLHTNMPKFKLWRVLVMAEVRRVTTDGQDEGFFTELSLRRDHSFSSIL